MALFDKLKKVRKRVKVQLIVLYSHFILVLFWEVQILPTSKSLNASAFSSDSEAFVEHSLEYSNDRLELCRDSK